MDQIDKWILADAVTSGGLLIAVSNDQADDLLTELREQKVEAAIIGEILDGASGTISVH